MSLATPPAPPTLLPPYRLPKPPVRESATPRWSRLVVPTAVLLAALGAAAFAYGHFLQADRYLWDSTPTTATPTTTSRSRWRPTCDSAA